MAFCGTHPKKKDFSGENTWVEGCVVFSVKRLPSSTWLERLLPPAQELDTLLAGSPLRNMSGTNTHFFGTKPKTLISRFEVCFFPHLGGLNNGISVPSLVVFCLFVLLRSYFLQDQVEQEFHDLQASRGLRVMNGFDLEIQRVL